jgi:hypothetical protein
MGFMDKVKSQATQLAEKAQEGLQTGKGKLDEMQERKRAGGLLQELGAIVYRRHTGRGGDASSGDLDRLVAQLKQIEDAGIEFLPGAGGANAPASAADAAESGSASAPASAANGGASNGGAADASAPEGGPAGY